MVCQLCFPGAVDIAEIIPGYDLIYFPETDKYLLYTDNDSIIINFDEKPEVEPYKGISDDDLEALPEEEYWKTFHWGTKVGEITKCWKFSMELGHDICKSCAEAGHNREEECYTAMWLYGRIADMIAEYDAQKQEDVIQND